MSSGPGLPQVLQVALGHCVRFSSLWLSSALPLCPDFVSQHKVGSETQGDEENPQDNEVQVELGVLHVQLSENGRRLLEVARIIDVTVQVLAVEAIDGEDDPFEPISEEGGASVRRAQEPSPLPLPTSAEGKVPPPSPHPQPGSPPSPEIFLPGTLPNDSTASSDKSIQWLDDVFSNFVSSKVSTKKTKNPPKKTKSRYCSRVIRMEKHFDYF